MKLTMKMDDGQINAAINALIMAKANLEAGVKQTVQILATDGADIANICYGNMATAVDGLVNNSTSNITVSGDTALIAEFGAGDATIPGTGFTNSPSTPVFAGSYSLLVGTGQYASLGMWEFPPGSNNWMTEVQPRKGLRQAKSYIITNGVQIAKGVIKL